LLRSGTSVGAHYREAQRAKSNADFINKIEGALQELDESGYWLLLSKDQIQQRGREIGIKAKTQVK
jgi:four helix bundle protein